MKKTSVLPRWCFRGSVGRGLTTGQDGRHYVRLCLARAVYPFIALFAGAGGCQPNVLLQKNSWAVAGGSGARERPERTRRGAGGPADGLDRARSAPGGRTWRPAAVPGGLWPGVVLCLGLLGGLVGPRPRDALGFCGATTEEALLGPRLTWGLAVWTCEGEARTETSWRGEAFSRGLGGSSLLSLAFGGSRPEYLDWPPGCLLRTRGGARSAAVPAVVVVARGG
ncbi:hypothetical protein NDU88_005615 [Pleurodeles waltl]|uniref:Uncharacterized protein n=1 Tax=Pleurodeles waltl TaxID=8319 RepID=A0AAV7WV88_PLEWA|nr:hypothetical protein NDU88_005615 [Pleurodeles waltl]